MVTDLSRIYDHGQPWCVNVAGHSDHNGDYPDARGRVADVRRIHYYREHLRELARAIQDGADVRGYHSWSMLDNFEWSEGYTQRFGMVFVDFPTQRRFMKDSGKWYARVASTNTVEASAATT